MPTPTGISGSRAAAIIGLSKYSTPFTVWQDIMEQRHGDGWNEANGYVYEPFQGNSATEFGHCFETPIIELTEKRTGHQIIDRERVFGFNNITCHVDGIINKKLFEGKTANNRVFGLDWGEPGTDRIPTAYQCQIQHNLLCSGLTEAVMSVLVFPCTVQDFEDQGWKVVTLENPYTRDQRYALLQGEWTSDNQPVDPMEWAKVFAQIGNFHNYYIEAKPDTQKLLLEMYEDFWQKYVVEETPPDAVDYSDIKRQFSDPKGTLIISETDKQSGELIADAMREYKSVGREIGKAGYLSKRREFLKTQILKFARDKTTVEDDDSQEKIVFLDETGRRLGSYDGRIFRTPNK
jgi:predicted phage-related endonuclease